MTTRRLRGEGHAAIYDRFLYSDLSDKAVRLLLVLDRCQNKGVAFPGRQWLADRLGCSTDTVDRALVELEGAGAIVTVRAPRPGGGRPMASYYLWPAVDDDQSRTDADLIEGQSRTHAASKPQTARIAPLIRNKSEPKSEAGADPPSRKTRCPDPFIVTADMHTWREREVPNVDWRAETRKFVDHWRSNGERKVDWVATWRNWMRRATSFGPRTAVTARGRQRDAADRLFNEAIGGTP